MRRIVVMFLFAFALMGVAQTAPASAAPVCTSTDPGGVLEQNLMQEVRDFETDTGVAVQVYGELNYNDSSRFTTDVLCFYEDDYTVVITVGDESYNLVACTLGREFCFMLEDMSKEILTLHEFIEYMAAHTGRFK